MSLFPDLPDDARVWVHTAERPLTDEEQQTLVDQLSDFAAGWTSHNRPVRGRVGVLHDRFLVLAAALDAGDISGCGIDAGMHAVDEAARSLHLSWVPALHVVYREADGTIQTAARPAFRALVEAGHVTASTPVFDPSLTTLGALRSGALEQPAGASWHGRVFRIPEAA